MVQTTKSWTRVWTWSWKQFTSPFYSRSTKEQRLRSRSNQVVYNEGFKLDQTGETRHWNPSFIASLNWKCVPEVYLITRVESAGVVCLNFVLNASKHTYSSDSFLTATFFKTLAQFEIKFSSQNLMTSWYGSAENKSTHTHTHTRQNYHTYPYTLLLQIEVLSPTQLVNWPDLH